MSEAFKVGDVVILKSGGNVMTVEETEDGYVSCVWSDGKKVDRSTFPSGTLEKYNKS